MKKRAKLRRMNERKRLVVFPVKIDDAPHKAPLIRRLGVLFGRADNKIQTCRLYVLKIRKDSCFDLIDSSLYNLLERFVIRTQSRKIELDSGLAYL
jgi:hypothetical protein